MSKLIAIILLGFSTGMDNFAVSIAMGISGIKKSHRIRIALSIGLAESTMTVIGLLLGGKLHQFFGDTTHYIGAALLIATGAYAIVDGYREGRNDQVDKINKSKKTQQFFTILSLSIDNAIVGFGVGTQSVPVLEAFLLIALISICLAMSGIYIGGKISYRIEEYAEFISGSILILIGILVGLKAI